MIINRRTVIETLTPLLKSCARAEKNMGTVAALLSDIQLKTQFIRHWQRHAECVEDLEQQIRLHGAGNAELKKVFTDDSDRVKYPMLDEGNLLTKAVVVEDDLSKDYEATLQRELPVDIRMLLERHILVFEEIRRHVSSFQRNMAH